MTEAGKKLLSHYRLLITRQMINEAKNDKACSKINLPRSNNKNTTAGNV